MRIHSDIFEAISKMTPGPYQNQIPGASPRYGIGEAAGPPWQPKEVSGRSRFRRIERRETARDPGSPYADMQASAPTDLKRTMRTERTAQISRYDDEAHDEHIVWCGLQKRNQHYTLSNKSALLSIPTRFSRYTYIQLT